MYFLVTHIAMGYVNFIHLFQIIYFGVSFDINNRPAPRVELVKLIIAWLDVIRSSLVAYIVIYPPFVKVEGYNRLRFFVFMLLGLVVINGNGARSMTSLLSRTWKGASGDKYGRPKLRRWIM